MFLKRVSITIFDMSLAKDRRKSMAGKTVAEMTVKRAHIISCAAKLFLENGYSNATVRDIAKSADVPVSAVYRLLGEKEALLCELVKFVLQRQFDAASELIKGLTEDKILYYAAETTLQLYLVESNENIRDLYSAAYSLSSSMQLIQTTITEKLMYVFKEHLPNYEEKDFYKKEIASGGIMRGFMTIPCDMWFTMDQKVEAFLENTFLLYHVPEKKIKEAIKFVSQFDYKTIVQGLVEQVMQELEEMTG